MELYEILILLLGLITAIGLDRVYRLFKDIQDNGVLNTIDVEYSLPDEGVQKVVDLVLDELEKRKQNGSENTTNNTETSGT